MKNDLAIFEQYKIRRVFDEATETWYFLVVDIIQVLIQQNDFQTARKYWNKLKERLKKEGSQTVTNCHQLKMTAEAGKKCGGIAKRARLELEAKTGKKVVSGGNFLPPKEGQKLVD